MHYYTFPISVQAYSEAEAKAKLNLLLAFGSFLVDFKIGNLAKAFVNAKLMESVGKAINKDSDEAMQTDPVDQEFEELKKKFRRKRVLREAKAKEEMAK